MQTLKLNPTRPHTTTSRIAIGLDLTKNITKLIVPGDYSSLFILSDAHTARLATSVGKQLSATTLDLVKQPEKQKSFLELEGYCKQLAEHGADRHSLLICIGGGAVSDLGGLISSLYMRGMHSANIPTTLLAQVDASIGGKTGINAFGIKNLIGAFSQPELVIIDPSTLRGLPRRELASGSAELLKHGLIADARLWQQLSQIDLDRLLNEEKLFEDLVLRSCMIKNKIVGADETEVGERKKLNFGHTVGHALEALSHATDKPYLHGEAVALGMIVEATLSDLPSNVLHDIRTVLQAYELPVLDRLNLPATTILKQTQTDKKNQAGIVRWTLLRSVGHAVYDQTRSAAAVIAALESIRS